MLVSQYKNVLSTAFSMFFFLKSFLGEEDFHEFRFDQCLPC